MNVIDSLGLGQGNPRFCVFLLVDAVKALTNASTFTSAALLKGYSRDKVNYKVTRGIEVRVKIWLHQGTIHTSSSSQTFLTVIYFEVDFK